MSISVDQLWQRTLAHLRQVIPERTVDNWLVDAVPDSFSEKSTPPQLTLLVPSSFCKDYVLGNFRNKIERALQEIHGGPVEFLLQVDPSIAETVSPSSSSTSSSNSRPREEDYSQRDPSAPVPKDQSSRPPAERQASDQPSANTDDQRSHRTSTSPSSRSNKESNPASSPFSPKRPPSTQPSGQEENEGNSSPVAARERSPSSPRSVTSSTPPKGPQRRENNRLPQTPSKTESTPESSFIDTGPNLRPEFTFDQFLEGDSNRLARNASIAVAKEPGGTKYNPLVVYGDVGLGKTHLAQAIANHARTQETAAEICYVSSERFTSQFVTAIREDNFNAFSSQYRSVDLLIVDDVQFFGGKEKTQEEFFHLFNALHQHEKQIVLCADRPPEQISGIEERLLSRFQWGLTADIQRPGLEMRIAVLQLKADQLGLSIETDILELIAQNVTENVRQLEGALKQLTARAELVDGSVTSKVVREILEREYGADSQPRQASVEDVIEGVSSYYDLPKEKLISRSRQQEISNARQVAMYLAREFTDLSYASIGVRFGGRDHSTVIHACNKIEDQIEIREDFKAELESMRSSIRGKLYS